MKPKSNGKTPSGGPGKAKRPRPTAADDPGFTATRASASAPGDSKEEEPEDLEDRDSGLKQAGLSDVGGTGPRKKSDRRH
jgi:hypothetical protein